MSDTPHFDVPAPGQSQPHTWVHLHDLVICLTLKGDIPDAVWMRFVKDVNRPEVKVILGLSYESVSVNSVQRKAVSEAIAGKKLAAVLKSPVTRGILTALGWLGLNIKAFAWEKLEDAIDYLGSELIERRQIVGLVEQLLERSGAPSLQSLQD